MIVLGVETSCDETAVAIVKDGREILANAVFTQIALHQPYGGVVPEIASRHHIQKITYVFDEAFRQAGLAKNDVDLVCATTHPGLIGSLLVGMNASQAFALAEEKEFMPINHLTGHIYANALEHELLFPLVALVVSGGHTQLILMERHYDFKLLGETMDDAIGEVFDKVGRVCGLPYPGGIAVDRLARTGNPERYALSLYDDPSSFNFSFSGIKSNVINLVNTLAMKHEELDKEGLCASFQKTTTLCLARKTVQAARKYHARQVIVAGGVAANSGLRSNLGALCAADDLPLSFPSLKYCTDNGAMIAASGYYKKTYAPDSNV